MITENYCSYEVAKLLKEKGFDGKSYGIYIDENTFEELDFKSSNTPETSVYRIVAPTLQMAMKWLMDNYNLFFKPEPIMTKYGELKWVINIYNISIYYVDLNSFEHLNTTVKCNSLYDAIEKALKHSLKYLVKKC